MPNRLTPFRIEEFPGINVSASARLTQVLPKVLKGFDLSRLGAWRAAYSSGSTAYQSMNGFNSERLYTETGLFLGTASLNGPLDSISLTGTSVDGLTPSLVPNLGVVGNFAVIGTDLYQMGAVGLYSGETTFSQFPVVSGMTITTPAASTSMPAITNVDVLVFILAPTSAGLVAYQSLLGSTTVGSGEQVVVTLDDVLPAGFGIRVYMADSDDTSITGYGGISTGESTVNASFSDGSNEIVHKLIDYDPTIPTGAGIIKLSSSSSGVELHRRRLWTLARQQQFGGPFYVGYSQSGWWTYNVYVNFSSYGIADLELFTLPDAAAMDTAFDSSTELGFVVDGIELMRLRDSNQQSPNGETNNSVFQDYWFGGREDHFKFGIRTRVDYDSSGRAADAYCWYIYEHATGHRGYSVDSSPWDITLGDGLYSIVYVTYFRLPTDVARIEFWVDYTAGTGQVVHKDSSGNVLDTFPFATGGSTALNVYSSAGDGSGEMFVMRTPTTPDDTLPRGEFDFSTAEFYEDKALTTLFDDVPVANWDGSSSTVPGTNYTWNITAESGSYGQVGAAPSSASPYASYPVESTIAYSDIGYVNWVSNPDQVLNLSLTNSEEITALVSTAAGLLALANNEAFMIRGDPDLADIGDFAVQKVSGTIGCDPGKRPARLGGSIAIIWKGRLFAATFGMGDVDFGSTMTEIGRPIHEASDLIEQVVADTARREFVALTANGRVLRYDIEAQQWYTDAFSDDCEALLPASPIPDGVLYGKNDGSFYTLVPHQATSSAPGIIEFEDVDAGDPTSMKLWRRIRIYMNEEYTGAPTMYYDTGRNSATVYGYGEQGGEWVFTFRAGVVARELRTLRFSFADTVLDDYVEPPIILEYVPKYNRR